ncbi:MAG: hypothetical protein GY938_12905 [Ketobacter sp.]|nr:hypothetical protein [Ketobacter sp.]
MLKPNRITNTVEAEITENLGRQFKVTTVFAWDNVSKHYRSGKGRVEVPRSREVRSALQIGTRAKVDMEAISLKLRRGLISLEEWQIQMARAIKSQHIAQLGLARGGVFSMAPADQARAAEMIKFQLEKLVGFAEGIKSGKVNLNSKKFMTRAKMYGDAGKTTYWQGVRQNSLELGMTEERNILGATEQHCVGCIDEEARGWVKIGELIPVGARICLTNCLCNVIFRGPKGRKYQ